jgi:aminoglycoside phosphotransferase family enzyme
VNARYQDCQEEIRLNQRLARSVYFGLVPLAIDTGGQIRLNGQGQIIDWLTKMLRLPANRMLHRLIRTATLKETDVRNLAATLCRFYRDSAPVPMTPADYVGRFEEDVRANAHELSQPEYGLSMDRVARIATAQRQLLEREHELLETRVLDGRIIEAHGDLRPEHICLATEPKIIDCLEFKRAFRILDPAEELAFLAMECEQLGASSVGDILFDAYARVTGDRPPTKLLRFYKSCRASLRAKLAIWHIKERETTTPARWSKVANRYLRLSEMYLAVFR